MPSPSTIVMSPARSACSEPYMRTYRSSSRDTSTRTGGENEVLQLGHEHRLDERCSPLDRRSLSGDRVPLRLDGIGLPAATVVVDVGAENTILLLVSKCRRAGGPQFLLKATLAVLERGALVGVAHPPHDESTHDGAGERARPSLRRHQHRARVHPHLPPSASSGRAQRRRRPAHAAGSHRRLEESSWNPRKTAFVDGLTDLYSIV